MIAPALRGPARALRAPFGGVRSPRFVRSPQPWGRVRSRPRPPGARTGAHRAAICALWLLAALLGTLGPLAPIPAARAAGRVYRNEALRILALEIPRGFTPAPQVSWPGVLLIASGSGKSAGARLVAAAQKVIPGQDALSLAAEARAGLLKQGFRDPRVSDRAPGTGGESRAQIDGFYDRERPARRGEPQAQGPLVLRQLYVVSGDVAVVLTLTAPQESAAAALADFGLFSESLVIAPQPLVPVEPKPAPAPDGGAASPPSASPSSPGGNNPGAGGG